MRVAAFNTAEGWARDFTEDIAHVVLSMAHSEPRSIGIAAQEFLVRVLGVDATKTQTVPAFVRYWTKADKSGFWREMVCLLLTQSGHRTWISL